VIGYYPREKEFKQALTLDVEMTVPGPAVFTSDRLHDTLDYGRVVQRIHEELAATHFRLLERVSEHLAQMILTEFPTSRVKLTIAKLGIIAGVTRCRALRGATMTCPETPSGWANRAMPRLRIS
jgi:7,8-dihydroneopterin aldolase/epimerase/oxygenase